MTNVRTTLNDVEAATLLLVLANLKRKEKITGLTLTQNNGSGIGTSTHVSVEYKDSIYNHTYDITDYDSW